MLLDDQRDALRLKCGVNSSSRRPWFEGCELRLLRMAWKRTPPGEKRKRLSRKCNSNPCFIYLCSSPQAKVFLRRRVGVCRYDLSVIGARQWGLGSLQLSFRGRVEQFERPKSYFSPPTVKRNPVVSTRRALHILRTLTRGGGGHGGGRH